MPCQQNVVQDNCISISNKLEYLKNKVRCERPVNAIGCHLESYFIYKTEFSCYILLLTFSRLLLLTNKLQQLNEWTNEAKTKKGKKEQNERNSNKHFTRTYILNS